MKDFKMHALLSFTAFFMAVPLAQAQSVEIAPLTEGVAAEEARPVDPETSARTIVTPAVGFGWSSEEGFEGESLHFRVSLDAAYLLTDLVSVRGRVRDHFYRRQYLTDRPSIAGQGLSRAEVDEQKLDLDAMAVFDLDHAFGISGSGFRLAAGVGPSFRFFINDALPSQFGGPAVELQAGYALSSFVELSAGVGYGYNLFFPNADLLSAVGGPQSHLGLNGALSFRFPPDVRVAFAWDGEMLQLKNSLRQYHSLSLVLELSL